MPNKTNFKVALASAGMTQRDWATKHGVSLTAVLRVFNGKTVSQRLTAEIERFTEQEFRRLLTLSTSNKEANRAA